MLVIQFSIRLAIIPHSGFQMHKSEAREERKKRKNRDPVEKISRLHDIAPYFSDNYTDFETTKTITRK